MSTNEGIIGLNGRACFFNSPNFRGRTAWNEWFNIVPFYPFDMKYIHELLTLIIMFYIYLR